MGGEIDEIQGFDKIPGSVKRQSYCQNSQLFCTIWAIFATLL